MRELQHKRHRPLCYAGFLEIEMAERMSLADQAVHALAMVRAMDDETTMEHPERHAVRALKRVAECVLTDAFRTAQDLAWQAKDLRKLALDIEASAEEGKQHE